MEATCAIMSVPVGIADGAFNKRMHGMHIRNATMRKVRNRGLTPIRYLCETGSGNTYRQSWRNGWLTGKETKSKVQIRLIGDESNRWITKEDMRHVREL